MRYLARIDQVHAPEPLPQDLIDLAMAQDGALSGAQVRSLLREWELARQIRPGGLHRLWRGAFVLDGMQDSGLAVLSATALTLGRRVTGCLPTAAAVHGFDLSDDDRVHVLGNHPSRLANVVVHQHVSLEAPVAFGSNWITGPTETAVRLAAAAPNPERALAVLDLALRADSVSRTELLHVADLAAIRGITTVRRVIPLADPRAESPAESWLRWACHDAGLPPPVPQYWVTGADGRGYRLDLAWPEARVGLEYDGVEFHTGGALTRDRARLNALVGAGWKIIAVTAAMLWSERPALMAQLRSHLLRRAS